ncbi:ABC transporter permease [Acidovorax sp. Root275]|uniref:amino acid ABC transporter permease n=1 Tax=Acidovorax sp. Root275 TaxID=1736508 RepID=UPI0007107BA0|nr:amino acid ABC transporter permease [Acidovorax sp. Root275]KRD46428.1 ABC transporter permease [Acidovorax sp. Root275]
MKTFFATYAEYMVDWWPRLLEAAVVTAELSAIGFVIALVLGAVLVWMLRSGVTLLRHGANGFIQLLRAVPLLALLLAIYFALPAAGVTLSGYWAGAIGLGVHGAAYVAEVLRGGLKSVHGGQREAGLAAGLTPRQVFLYVTLPQALRVMLPPLLNSYVALLKDSSLCALIATNELMLTAKAMSSEYFLPLHIFMLVGLLYFAIAFPLSMLSRWLERRLAHGRRTVGAA